jgi:hypothetical protein
LILVKSIYTAGPFSWQRRILGYANQLEALGYEITGEWLHQESTFTNPDNTTKIKKPGLHADCERLSIRDLSNIAHSDTLILFEPGTAVERNTRVAEFGAALAWGLQCIVIQPPDEDKKEVISNIFVKLKNPPEDWMDGGRLSRIKRVIEFRSWEDFYNDITNPTEVQLCSGCGDAECDSCPCGTFTAYKTASGLRVIPPTK